MQKFLIIVLAAGLLPFFISAQPAVTSATRVKLMKGDSTFIAPLNDTRSIDFVSDSAAFRAYNSNASVIIMSDAQRGGKFRKCTSCAADQYMVFSDASSQKWERFDFGEYIFPEWFGLGANTATLALRRTIRYAEKTGLKIMLRGIYSIRDSIHIRGKIYLEGANSLNETSSKSFLEFDLPGNRPAFWVNPVAQSMQGPSLHNVAFRDLSATGDHNAFEMYAAIADSKYLSSFEAYNTYFEGFNRYAFYFSDLYTSNLNIQQINVISCGGIIGVDMSGTKLVVQSQGDSWHISNAVTGGVLPAVVGQDSAIIDVRDVGNVVVENATLQGDVGTGSKKQLIWADFGSVQINQIYVEMTGSGAIEKLGKLGNIDNTDCFVDIEGLYLSVNSSYAAKTFDIYGNTSVDVKYIEFGPGNPQTLFTKRGAGVKNIKIEKYVKSGRPVAVDAFSYKTDISICATQDFREITYPASGELWKLGLDTLFGPTGYGSLTNGGGSFSQDIDAEKGKVFKLTTTANRAFFTWDIALPPKLRGRTIIAKMTYKFVVNDSTGGDVDRWAIYDPVGTSYIEMGRLKLNKWAVATTVFEYPAASSTVQLVFGDANGKFSTKDCQFWVADISLRYGTLLEGEANDASSKKRLIFRKNISGVNAAGFLDGDLVSTESGLYIKKSGAFEAVGAGGGGNVSGSGTSDQMTFWNGTNSVTGYSGFAKSGNDLRIGPASGGNRVEINPASAQITLHQNGIATATLNTNTSGKLETNVGLQVTGASEVNGNLNVTGNLSTSSHFSAPGLTSAATGTGGTTPAGTLNLWAPNSASSYISFSENAAANRGAFGFPASSPDMVWSFGNQILSSGTERMRLKNNGFLVLDQLSTSATALIGRNASKEISSVTLGSGLSLSGGVLNTTVPSGTSTQTLRYDATNTLVATSQITNDGSTVGIGTAPNASYELDVAGKTRAQGLRAEGTTMQPSLELANTTPTTGKTFTMGSSNTGTFYISSDVAGDLINGDHATGEVTVNGKLTVNSFGSTATSLWGGNATNELTPVTIGSGLSLTSGTLSATGGGVNVIRPTNLTSDQDNYAPTGWSTANKVLITGDATGRAITSFSATGITDGHTKTIINNGDNYIYFPAEHPDGTAINRIDYTRDFILTPKSAMDIMYDATDARWMIVSPNYNTDRDRQLTYTVQPGSVTAGDWGHVAFGTVNVGSLNQAQPIAGVPGVFRLSTSTSAAGGAYMGFAKSQTLVTRYGDAHLDLSADVSIPTLSDASNRFYAALHFGTDQTSATFPNVHQVGIRYKDNQNGGRWEGYTRAGTSSETTVDLGVTVAANTLYSLRIVVDEANTEARFYIDNVYRGRIIASGNQFPSAATAITTRALCFKELGTTARSMDVAKVTLTLTY